METNGTCFVCQCGRTITGEPGREQTTFWTGTGCEKRDVSSQFSLLFFTSIGILLLMGFSVGLLAKIGGVDLPSQLAAVGPGPLKKD